MADAYKTIADFVRINDANIVDAGMSDILNASPALAAMPVVGASHGTIHKYMKKTVAPSVGFRAANEGRENTKGTQTSVTVNLKLLDASSSLAAAVASDHPDGREGAVRDDASDNLQAALFKIEQQVWYGTANDSAGFAGIFEDTTFDDADDSRVVNAGGTTADTGSSVVLARLDARSFAVVAGNDGVVSIGQSVYGPIEDQANGGRFPGYFTPIEGWFGVQMGSVYDVARIANLTEDAGKGLTDDLIYSTKSSKFKAGRQPNTIVMTRRSMNQLVASRVATNPTGAPVAEPETVYGMNIIVVDSLSDTEALLTNA